MFCKLGGRQPGFRDCYLQFRKRVIEGREGVVKKPVYALTSKLLSKKLKMARTLTVHKWQFFFNLVPSGEETSFLTTFYDLYFSHHYAHITLQIMLDLLCGQLFIFVFKFEQSSYLFSLKNSCPCQDLNLGPPRYQADMLPIELSWLG